jgi:hypothetical protein
MKRKQWQSCAISTLRHSCYIMTIKTYMCAWLRAVACVSMCLCCLKLIWLVTMLNEPFYFLTCSICAAISCRKSTANKNLRANNKDD